MIGYLSGKVKFIFGEEIILDVQGVGYRISVNPAGLEIGAAAEFFIHTAVREDAINLYGFKNREAFELFENLLTVSGVGAKSALAIVSKISVAEFTAAVVNQDLNALVKLPGVGKKSAQRILLELKDKIKNISTETFAQVVPKSSATDEATEALSALGYTSAEISSVLKRAPKNSSTEQLIKFALKELNKF
ncbi:MAG: Holliday junction branch migration protein RuvA [Selenomonadaceae bacterium]|nr:Holliday junction branch migration protein RuvA [Selenomonadaceae bacterium]